MPKRLRSSRSPADFVARSVRDLPPSGIRKFFDLVVGRSDIISLGVGEPDFVTPWRIREAGIYSLERGHTTYTSNLGLLELRQAVACHLAEWLGISYNAEQEVLITVGVAEGIDLALRAVLEPGDEVLIPEPCFVSYGPCTVLAGGKPVYIPLKAENDFRLTPEDLYPYLTSRSKVLLLGFPNNPTGAVMSEADLARLTGVVEAHDLLVISDEIYGHLTYGGEHSSFAALPGMRDRSILLGGFSKAYAMTGWRIGYACAAEPVLAAMMKIHQYGIMCAPTTGQLAALEALKSGAAEREQMRIQYQRRRNLMLQGFQEMGLSCPEPKGAFYVFPSVASTGLSSEEFALRLLEEEQVAVVPGNAFGRSGEGFVRCSYAASTEKLTEALRRISRFVGRTRRG